MGMYDQDKQDGHVDNQDAHITMIMAAVMTRILGKHMGKQFNLLLGFSRCAVMATQCLVRFEVKVHST